MSGIGDNAGQGGAVPVHARVDLYKRGQHLGKIITNKGLHIDFGNSGLRIVVHTHVNGNDTFDIVKRVPSVEESGNQNAPVNHPVHIFVFDDYENREGDMEGPPCHRQPRVFYGDSGCQTRKHVSAKLGFYVLAGIPDNMMQQRFPELEELCQHAKATPDINNTLRRGIHAVLVNGFESAHRLMQSLDGSGQQLDIISATVPDLYNLSHEQEYGDRIMAAFEEVYGYPPKRIVFQYEAQAAMHFLVKPSPRNRELRSNLCFFDNAMGNINLSTQHNAMLMIDVGDHTVDTALMSIFREANGEPSILQISQDQGCFGGTSLFAHEVVRLILEKNKKKTGKIMPEWQQRELLKSFDDIKHTLGAGRGTILHTSKSGGNDDDLLSFQVRANEIQSAFETAYLNAKVLLKARILELKKYGASCVLRVIVGGGSSCSSLFQQWLDGLCSELGVEFVYISRAAMGSHEETARLAMGAAWATITAPSVKDFLRTAAFGIQEKSWKAETGEYCWADQPYAVWYNQGQVFGLQYRFTFSGNDNEEVRIICLPKGPTTPVDDDLLDHNALSYDLLTMRGFPQGTFSFRFRVNQAEERITLTIHRNVGETAVRWKHKTEFSTTITVQPGAGVISIFEPETDDVSGAQGGFRGRLDELIRNLPHRELGRASLPGPWLPDPDVIDQYEDMDVDEKDQYQDMDVDEA